MAAVGDCAVGDGVAAWCCDGPESFVRKNRGLSLEWGLGHNWRAAVTFLGGLKRQLGQHADESAVAQVSFGEGQDGWGSISVSTLG